MFQIEKFKNLPQHQSLLDRAARVITEDLRVIGLYVGGHHTADEYSDIDLYIVFKTEEDRESFKKDKLTIAQKIGKIKVETMDVWRNRDYHIIFDPEEIQVDFVFLLISSKHHLFNKTVDILYDPEGHIQEIVKESRKITYEDWLSIPYCDRSIKSSYILISYIISKSEISLFLSLPLSVCSPVSLEKQAEERSVVFHGHFAVRGSSVRSAIGNKCSIETL